MPTPVLLAVKTEYALCQTPTKFVLKLPNEIYVTAGDASAGIVIVFPANFCACDGGIYNQIEAQ